jgi:hypothetical protein
VKKNNGDSRGKYSRQFVREKAQLGRLWVLGRSQQLADVPRKAAAHLYRIDWDGCKTLWKTAYRERKERGLSTSAMHI